MGKPMDPTSRDKTLFKFTTILLAAVMSGPALSFSPQELWDHWPGSRFETTPAPCLRHASLSDSLARLQSLYPQLIQLEEAGKSFQGRGIKMLSLGSGELKILLWSQMHGNEPSATPALLDMAHYLAGHPDDPAVRKILDRFTLLMIPMLNPDGTENYIRRNAQGIDINRDALSLATPEGRILKEVRDRFEPMLGFNLHDQNRRTSVGSTGVLATNSVLSVSGDEANTLTPERARTKRVSAAIVEALAPFMPGGMARYDEDWSPRAFGDNLTAWGTPVVLIESGGLPPGHEFTELTRLNFVAILYALHGLAVDDLAAQDTRVYEDLQRNRSDAWSDIAVRGGYMMQPGSPEIFEADLAFDVLRSDQQWAGCEAGLVIPSSIFLVGDAGLHGAGRDIDARGQLILAPFDVGILGFTAREWLTSATLARMASSGIGRVYWSVKPQKQLAAQETAEQLAARGLPQIRVVVSGTSLPALVLAAPPPKADSPLLADVLTALGINSESDEVLRSLWIENPTGKNTLPRLRKGQDASFLMVSRAPGGGLDFQQSRLEAVWLDGYQLGE